MTVIRKRHTPVVIALLLAAFGCDGCPQKATASAKPTPPTPVIDAGSAATAKPTKASDPDKDELNQETEWALGNMQRTKLLAQPHVKPMVVLQKYDRAICAAGVLPVQFEAEQTWKKDWNGREISFHFDKIGGARFKALGAPGTENEHCLIVSRAFLEKHPVARVETKREKCSADLARRIEVASKPWRVSTCELGARIEGDWRFAAVQFKPHRGELRAGLVLSRGSEVFLQPLIANKNDPSSCWRVDDGCEFNAGAFSVSFALDYDHRPAMVLEWMGEEGTNVRIYAPRGRTLVEISENYYYHAPW